MTIGRALVALSLACSSSCVSLNYSQSAVGSPVDEAALAGLEPGSSNLATCLAALGAPALVWPSDAGFVNLAYAWTDASDWGISVSWSFDRFLSLRTSFDSADFEAESVVLAFDESLALHHISRGFLFDLVPSAQQSTAAARMMQRAAR